MAELTMSWSESDEMSLFRRFFWLFVRMRISAPLVSCASIFLCCQEKSVSPCSLLRRIGPPEPENVSNASSSGQGISRKKIVRIQSQERAAEDEANFLANLFQSGMDDWEVVDIFNEP